MHQNKGRHIGGENILRQDASLKIRQKKLPSIRILTFFIFFILWVIFSGRFDAFHLVLGAISCGIVTAFSGDLLFAATRPKGIFRLWFRTAAYVPWLLYQIFIANLHMLYLVFHPRMRELIDPHIITFNSRLQSDYAKMLFANSITLTPGTITVNASVSGKFSVHCIDTRSGEGLPGEMEDRVARIFRTGVFKK